MMSTFMSMNGKWVVRSLSTNETRRGNCRALTKRMVFLLIFTIAGSPAMGGSIRHDVLPSVYEDYGAAYEGVGQIRKGGHSGSGVLIEDEWIVTAAHVANLNPGNHAEGYTIRFDPTSSSTNSKKVTIDQWWVNQFYVDLGETSSLTRVWDIAVGHLGNSVSEVTSYPIISERPELGTFVDFVGYGRKTNGIDGYYRNQPGILGKRGGTNFIGTYGLFDRMLETDFDDPSNPKGSRATAKEIGGVSGDSGRGLFATDPSTSQKALAGVFSTAHPPHGDIDGRLGIYGATNDFVDVNRFQPWIKDITTQDLEARLWQGQNGELFSNDTYWSGNRRPFATRDAVFSRAGSLYSVQFEDRGDGFTVTRDEMKDLLIDTDRVVFFSGNSQVFGTAEIRSKSGRLAHLRLDNHNMLHTGSAIKLTGPSPGLTLSTGSFLQSSGTLILGDGLGGKLELRNDSAATFTGSDELQLGRGTTQFGPKTEVILDQSSLSSQHGAVVVGHQQPAEVRILTDGLMSVGLPGNSQSNQPTRGSQDLIVGRGGNGSVTVDDGGSLMIYGSAFIGASSAGVEGYLGVASDRQAVSRVQAKGDLYMGGDGHAARILINDGARVTVDGTANLFLDDDNDILMFGGDLNIGKMRLTGNPFQFVTLGGRLRITDEGLTADVDRLLDSGSGRTIFIEGQTTESVGPFLFVDDYNRLVLNGSLKTNDALAIAEHATVETWGLDNSGERAFDIAGNLEINSDINLGGIGAERIRGTGQVIVANGATLRYTATGGVEMFDGSQIQLDGATLTGNGRLAQRVSTSANWGLKGHGVLSINDPNVFNGALLEADGGTLVVTNSLNGTSDAFGDGGVAVRNNATLILQEGGATGSVLVEDNARFETGNLMVRGNFVNAGTLAPGNSPGTLTIDGDLDAALGTLEIELMGTEVEAFDRLIVNGVADLGMIALILGYTPEAGDTFDVLDFTTLTDRNYSFDFSQAALDPLLEWDTSAFDTSGILSVAAIPEPASLVLLGLGGLCLLGRRRGNQTDTSPGARKNPPGRWRALRVRLAWPW